jgi:spermidine/putrescine transport system substrate-binding protein
MGKFTMFKSFYFHLYSRVGVLVFLSLSLFVTGCAPKDKPLADELVFADWEGDMPQSVLDAFTNKYGVKVTFVAYESQEEAINNIKAGQRYDVLVMESRQIPLMVEQGLLSELNFQNIPNFKNISPNFRDLVYDPGNRHCIPYTWGTTGLVVRSDLVAEPVTKWTDLWDPRYAGKVGIWVGQPREAIALTLKSLGYSANSQNPKELKAAEERLMELKPNVIFMEDIDPANGVKALTSGQVILAEGYAGDVIRGRDVNQNIHYILPEEGALLWGDTFVIPANSPEKYTAELFVDFVLRPEISAAIVNESHWATPNDMAEEFLDPRIFDDQSIFPPFDQLKNAEIILPISAETQKIYDQIWDRFFSASKWR